MALFFQSSLYDTLALLMILVAVTWWYFKNAYNYWKRKKMPFLSPRFPFGNSKQLIVRSPSPGSVTKEYYNEFKKRGEKFGGIYTITQPVVILVDPEYIKDVLSKDFNHFINRGFYYNEKDDPISAHLFAVDETKWKGQRIKLTPTFTSGKMKLMFNGVVECSEYMKEAFNQYAVKGEDIYIKDVMARFTTDVIGATAFGVNCNSFKYPDAEFRMMGIKLFDVTLLQAMKFFIVQSMPGLAKKLSLTTSQKEIADFFINMVTETVKYRETYNIKKPDFLQLLIDMKNDPDGTEQWNTLQMASQVVLFFVAGFDTSSTTMSFALYELARNPDIQEKLRKEINRVLSKHEGKISYDNLNEMTYLNQILDETLRMYPPIVTLSRVCTKDYQLRHTDIVIEKGTPVLIPLVGLHRDPDIYPDPDKFDPERFTEENKKYRHPYAHIPFGEGPRNCIGLRFGWMQSKIGIITVIKNFKICISPKTQMPVTIDPHFFLLQSKEKFYLKAEKI